MRPLPFPEPAHSSQVQEGLASLPQTINYHVCQDKQPALIIILLNIEQQQCRSRVHCISLPASSSSRGRAQWGETPAAPCQDGVCNPGLAAVAPAPEQAGLKKKILLHLHSSPQSILADEKAAPTSPRLAAVHTGEVTGRADGNTSSLGGMHAKEGRGTAPGLCTGRKHQVWSLHSMRQPRCPFGAAKRQPRRLPPG